MEKDLRIHPQVIIPTKGAIVPTPTGSLVGRPSWDDVYMKMAEAVSLRSKCTRAKVGCVIVASDLTIVSASYNGPSPRYKGSSNDRPCAAWCARSLKKKEELSPLYSDCPALHAEQNAVARSDWARTQGATAYVTSSVCFPCAKLLAAAGVSCVVHQVHEADAHRTPDDVESFLSRCDIKVIRV